MTDLEMTRLCAEAMGYRQDIDGGYSRLEQGAGMAEPDWIEFVYSPLHNDAQAMELVKRFRLDIKTWFGFPDEANTRWEIQGTVSGWERVKDKELNRAIVTCVAKMQAGAATLNRHSD